MDLFIYIIALITVLGITLIVRDTLDRKKVYDKKDFSRSIFFDEGDKKKFFFAYNLITFLNDLFSEDLSNQEIMSAINRWMTHFSQASTDLYLIELMKGNVSLPEESHFKAYLSKEDLKILKDRDKVNDLLRYIVETNLNKED